MAKHRGAPIQLVKLTLMDDFNVWCRARKTEMTKENLIEFLIQKKYLKGKQFAEFCDSITVSPTWFAFAAIEPMREGFIPPKTWIY